MIRAPIGDRLLSKLKWTNDGCLIFTGWTDERGYGRFRVGDAMRKPHRVAYDLWVGPIPPGMSVCHSCDNPSCCNVEHLFLGTHTDNMRDMVDKGRGSTVGLLRAQKGIGNRLRERAAQLRAEAAVAAGVPADWKHCAHCDQWLSPTAFGANARRPDGLQTYCRPCFAEYRTNRRPSL